jgi:predicted dinucleotide-binding enzyme
MPKKVIAIIGATEKLGSVFSKNLAKHKYRLLLFDHDESKLNFLAKEIKKATPKADIECMNCPMDASWEADIVITDIHDENELIQKTKPFANRKIVLSIFYASEEQELEKLLAGARLVKIFITRTAANFLNSENEERIELVLDSNDEEAIETATRILKEAGFDPVLLKTFLLRKESLVRFF